MLSLPCFATVFAPVFSSPLTNRLFRGILLADEGVVCAVGVASQHPGLSGLACFKLRDSCMREAYMESDYTPVPSVGAPRLVFLFVEN